MNCEKLLLIFVYVVHYTDSYSPDQIVYFIDNESAAPRIEFAHTAIYASNNQISFRFNDVQNVFGSFGIGNFARWNVLSTKCEKAKVQFVRVFFVVGVIL